MDISDVKIGIADLHIPPFENTIRKSKMYEKDGFDSLWTPDHIMWWYPDAIWTPDFVNVASFLRNPHDVYNVFPVLSIMAHNTKNVHIGTGVTETFRHHPALLAHLIITLDHISKGRIILGIGPGERENITPYGIKWENPVSRLEESIKIIKLLWKKDKKIDFNGKFWKLNDAVLSLKPYKRNKAPPIWVGAHGPKMLELTGKLGDGWLPFNLGLENYKKSLEKVQTHAKSEGRNIDEITPSIMLSVITDDNRDECNKLLETPLSKNQILTTSHEFFQSYGITHPLGDDFNGLIDYIPTKYDKETIMKAYDKISLKMCQDYYLNGTPDDIIQKLEKYIKLGAKHIILSDTTGACDLNKTQSSYLCIKKVLDYFKGT
jgi:phthiodiolone/phenolphthiodiolone dimycocerosates ketoreductase